MNFDPDVANSSGFFKDPGTRLPLTGNEERVVKCELLDNGKLIWPQVRFSDGTQGRIVFRLWTAEEKVLYRKYRGIGAFAEKEKLIKERTHPQVVREDGVEIDTYAHFTDDGQSTPAQSTLDFIKRCDTWLGPWDFDGILYDLLQKKGDRGYRPVPRCLVPQEDRKRLGIS